MAVTQFRLFKICTCLANLLSFFKRLICRTGRGRKLSGDRITLPTTVDFSGPKQPEVEEWSSWDEDAPTSIKIEGGDGTASPTPDEGEEGAEPDYFKDMAPTIRKTQKIVLKKREPLNYLVPDGPAGFSSRLAATQDMVSFITPSSELGEMDTWQESSNAWEDESSDTAWEAEAVLRQQKMVEREKRSMEQQRKKMEKDVQRMMKKEQKIAVKLS